MFPTTVSFRAMVTHLAREMKVEKCSSVRHVRYELFPSVCVPFRVSDNAKKLRTVRNQTLRDALNICLRGSWGPPEITAKNR